MNDKFIYKGNETRTIENADLVCKNCAFVYKDSVIECGAYHQKPLDILKGGKCPKKKQSPKRAV